VPKATFPCQRADPTLPFDPDGALPWIDHRGRFAQVIAMLEKIFAASIVVACVVMLVRLVLGAGRRKRFDGALARWGRRTGARIDRLFTLNAVRRRAHREAEEAIRRAKGKAGGDWEGNVYRPKSFQKKNDRRIH
jgi:hypothetical protein